MDKANKDYLSLMQGLVVEGAQIALDLFNDSEPSLKPDRSVVTKADLAISKLVKEKLQVVLSDPEHLLIEEEDPNKVKYCDDKLLKSKKYIWSIDPIDGTRAFSNKMPNFGISIGVLKDLKPYLGMIYLPILRELFVADGERAYFLENVSVEELSKIDIANLQLEINSRSLGGQKIKTADQEITDQSVFFGSENMIKKYGWNSEDCHFMNASCAVIALCWTAIGRGCGAFLDAHLWDFAGAWAIFHAAGLELRKISDGSLFEEATLDKFETDPSKVWKLRDYYILSSDKNFEILKSKLSS